MATGPAGLDTQDPAAAPTPSFKDRGKLRRRLRYLRRVRELGFRDLGGLVFDLHRFGHRGDELVAQKLQALAAVDAELRALERALGDERPFHELREPGLAACPRCGGIHGSDARYCPSCGLGLRGPQAIGEVGDGGPPAAAPAASTAVAPAEPAPAAPAVTTDAAPTTPDPDPETAPAPEATASAEPAEDPEATRAIPVVPTGDEAAEPAPSEAGTPDGDAPDARGS